MSDKLEFTGERFLPEQVREIWYEHWHRYVFALDFVAHLKVLDCACGEGYGSKLLAGSAAEVVGVDLNAAAIEHASTRYGKRDKLSFREADCTRLPFEDASFDAVVSFETIEHIEGQEAMLSEFARLLRPGGFLILSSPDKKTYSEDRDFHNEFHLRELYRDELVTMLSTQFPACRLYGQKLLFHSLIWSLDGTGRGSQLATLTNDELRKVEVPAHAPLYFLAIAARSENELPVTDNKMWLFDDGDQSVYEHYNAEVRHHIDSGVEFERMKRRITELEDELKTQSAHAPWWRRRTKAK